MKSGFRSLVVVLLLISFYCNVVIASNLSDQMKPSIIIYVLTDRNITENMDAKYLQSRNQLADWWEVDLNNKLKNHGGYDVKLIRNRDEFIAGPDTYLLISKIIQYNPGSASARFWVGFGAGYCSMDLHNELFGVDGKQIFAKDDHISSAVSWKKMVRKLNENILIEINKALSSTQK
jgi:hypothetical protein